MTFLPASGLLKSTFTLPVETLITRPSIPVDKNYVLGPGDELFYYPGEVNLRRADVVVINKIDSAEPDSITEVRDNIRSVNPKAIVIDAASPLTVEDPSVITGNKVLVVEDGPTLTHGEMEYGAGVVAAQKFGAAEIIDPRPWVVGTIAETFEKYPYIGELLPAMGYSKKQIKDLEKTINKVEADAVVVGTPIDLSRLKMKLNKPTTRVKYDLQEIGLPNLNTVLEGFMKKSKKATATRKTAKKKTAAKKTTKKKSAKK